MRADVPTIAEHLAARGYDTAGFVANLDYCSRETGVARGFLHYEDFPLSLFDAFIRYSAIGRRVDRVSWRFRIDSLLERWGGARAARWHEWIPGSREHLKNAEEINHAFLTWLDRKPPTPRPFFAFLNMNDAHSPYEIPDPRTPSLGKRPETATDREILQQFTGIDKMQLSTDHVRMLIDVYDDSVSYLDRQLGSLIDQLGRRGLLENTLLIIASDHGEHLGDHGLFFHGNSLYRQSVQVPLVIVGKSNGVPVGRTVAETVGLNDLPATMVDLLKLPGRAPFPGRSLRQYWDPRPPGASLVPDPILMETTRPVFLTNDGREPAAKGPMKSIIAGGMHYIQLADGTEQLFKISDVDENENLLFQPDTEPVLLQFRNLLGLMLQKR
jgi:arylsulfatase A-like enzyme